MLLYFIYIYLLHCDVHNVFNMYHIVCGGVRRLPPNSFQWPSVGEGQLCLLGGQERPQDFD